MKMENGKWKMEGGRWKIFLFTFHFTLSIFNSLASTHLSSPSLGTFFGIPPWLGDPNVPSERTYGSPDATNATHRIDNDALKAVAALFEGFEERAYYASEGPSNVWDEAVWGPTARGANKVPFRFDFGRTDWGTFVYSPDDDRRVTTRRFVEYNNLSSLASGLSRITNPPEDDVKLWDRVAVRRPLWRGGASTQSYTTPGWLWSSTLFDRLRPRGVVPQIPTFEWSRASTMLGYSPDEWGCSTLTWEDVARPHSDPLNWRSGELSEYRPVLSMMHGVNYGEPPFNDNRWYERFGDAFYTLTNTTCDVLEMPFAGYETWTERKTAVAIADAIDDILQQGVFSSYGYSLAHGVYSAVSGKWGYYEIEPYETFSISVRAEPDPNLPFFLDDDGTVSYFWIFTDLTVTRDSTGETAHADRADGFYVAVQAPGCRREDYAEIRCETTGDLARSGGYFEGLAFYNGYPAEYLMYIYDLQLRGESPEWSYDLGTISYPVIRSNTISRVRDFTTNDTRRLVTDRVAGIGQALSGLDRTYAPMNADVPAAKTTYSGDIYVRSDEVTYGGLSWSAGNDEYLLCSQPPVPFTGFGEVTNHLYVTNGPALSRPGYAVAGCSTSSDVLSLRGCMIATNIEVCGKIDDAEGLFEVIGRPEPGQPGRVFYVSRMSYRMTGPGTGVFSAGFELVPDIPPPVPSPHPTVFYFEQPFTFPLPTNGIPLVANADYTRSYSFAESVLTSGVLFGPGDDGILYPGSFDRVAAADLWSIESFMSKSLWRSSYLAGDLADPLFTDRYSTYCDDVLYRSKVSRYGSHSALRQVFHDLLKGEADKCAEFVENELLAAEGVKDFRDPFAVIPMAWGDAAVALDGNVLPHRDTDPGTPWTIARLVGSPPPQGDVYQIIVTNDGEVFWVRPYGDNVPFPWPMTFVHIHLEAVGVTDWKNGIVQRPQCHKIWGAAAKAKLRGMSKVDWTWNALKRD